MIQPAITCRDLPDDVLVPLIDEVIDAARDGLGGHNALELAALLDAA